MDQFASANYLHQLSTAVLVLDTDFVVIYANYAAEDLLGLGQRRLLGQKATGLYSQFATDLDSLRHTLAQGQGQSLYAISLVTLDGHHHTVDLVFSPLNQAQILVEARAVDHQQRINQELQHYAQQHAAQLLVRGLAHEIKNPLGGLRGAAQLLERELLDPELQEFTHIIIEQADRLRALVDRLLGPQYPGTQTEGNIHRLLEQVARLCEMESGHIVIERDYDPSIPDFMMDAEQLQQALLNVLRNAMQALGGEGKIVLRTRSQGQITIAGRRHRQAVAVSVIDNGPGIDPAIEDTLFYPMITNKADGSGLGLSIAQKIVNQHQGRIELESWPGHTEFTLLIPMIFSKETK